MIRSKLDQPIEVYWMPGCTSCLRMKEFIEKSGFEYDAINTDEYPEALEKLKRKGLLLPVTCVGENCVTGTNLGDVAKLLGIEYNPPVMLSPQALVDRYQLNQAMGCGFLAQMTQPVLDHRFPGRDREMLAVAYQVAMVARSFLSAYYDDKHDVEFYMKPDDVTSTAQVLALAEETRQLVDRWWREDGVDDPLDRITNTYWGHPTLHEVLEREVWHTTQHARQLMQALEEFDITPDQPFTKANLEGLPLPERVHG